MESIITEQYRIIAPGTSDTLWHATRHFQTLVTMVSENNIPHFREGKPGPWRMERRMSSETPDVL
jgi:hypothetical protein